MVWQQGSALQFLSFGDNMSSLALCDKLFWHNIQLNKLLVEADAAIAFYKDYPTQENKVDLLKAHKALKNYVSEGRALLLK
jgi:hypothetical protein